MELKVTLFKLHFPDYLYLLTKYIFYVLPPVTEFLVV